jgi:hypothetical protein
MMNSSLLFVLAALSLPMSAIATPGELQEQIRFTIKTQAQQTCDVSAISGDDIRLPHAIRQRGVNEVIAKVSTDGKSVRALVLIDTEIDGSLFETRPKFEMEYMTPNGGHIMKVSRGGSLDDLSIDAARGGRLAFTNSAQSGSGIRTRYYVLNNGHQSVAREAFEQYIQESVVDAFVKYICAL